MIAQIVGGIVRTLLAAYGGTWVAQGWMDQDELQQLIGAVITIVVLGWSVWQKKRTATVPGGEFNPRAEVRKAESAAGGVTRTRMPYRHSKGGKPGGYVLTPAVAALFWLLAIGLVFAVAALGQWSWESPDARGRASLPVEKVVTPEKAREWLQVREIEDARPFLLRLADSLNPGAKVRAIYMRNVDGDIYLAVRLDQVRLQGGAEF